MSLGPQTSPYEKLATRIVPFICALGLWIVCPAQVVMPAWLGGAVIPKALALLVLTTIIALGRTAYVLVQAQRTRGRIFSRRHVSVGSYWLVPVLMVALYLFDAGIPDKTLFSLVRGLLLGVGVGALSVGLVLPRLSYGSARVLLRPRPRNAWEYARMVKRIGFEMCVLGLMCLFAVAVL